MANGKIITGQNNIAKINNREAVPIGVKYYVGTNTETGGEQTAFYSLSDQKRSTFFVIDLETGDDWIPEEDETLQELIRKRDEYQPTSKEYEYYQNLIKAYYKDHPAFIRAK